MARVHVIRWKEYARYVILINNVTIPVIICHAFCGTIVWHKEESKPSKKL